MLTVQDNEPLETHGPSKILQEMQFTHNQGLQTF